MFTRLKSYAKVLLLLALFTLGCGTPSAHVALPRFPWPPPRASAFDQIPHQLLAGTGRQSLQGAADRLERALELAGYTETSYYRAPGGFVLVTRIECIVDDGTPCGPNDRWRTEEPRVHDLAGYLRALFFAPEGRYRVIAFVVTDSAWQQGATAPTREEVEEWLPGGGMQLPPEYGRLDFTAAHECTALIYEFKKVGEQVSISDPSSLLGRAHLERGGIWQGLSR
jgi:hypothetical protein